MVLNPVIIGAIIGQGMISKFSKIAGAVIGFVITTGILIWGLIAYAEGNQIVFFGIPFTQPVFIIACLLWYGFDIWEFNKSRSKGEDNHSDESINASHNVIDDAALDNKFEKEKEPVADPRYSCSNCDYSVVKKDFNQDTFFCPECGDRLTAG